MKVISTNLSEPKKVSWRGKDVLTGIYKYPVAEAIFLGNEIVEKDTIADRKVHGGVDKACYLFSALHYPYWRGLYPHLGWDWGMFGENITLDSMDERHIHIGDIYEIGSAVVQVSQPREPCYKLGIRFDNQGILKQFIEHGFPGTYVRIIKEGKVSTGDELKLVKKAEPALSIYDLYRLIFSSEKDPELLELAINHEALPQKKRHQLARYKKGGP